MYYDLAPVIGQPFGKNNSSFHAEYETSRPNQNVDSD